MPLMSSSPYIFDPLFDSWVNRPSHVQPDVERIRTAEAVFEGLGAAWSGTFSHSIVQ